MEWIEEEVAKIHQTLTEFISEGKSVVTSSSFQSHSIPLLHIIGSMKADIPVYFLNTGFHFPESVQFKNDVTKALGLNTKSLHSSIDKIHQKDANDHFLFASDPGTCCHINKVLPMDDVLKTTDIWIVGVRKGQTATRGGFEKIMDGPYNSKRYHPILEWSSKMINEYQKKYNLPFHPLEQQGYLSIGCEPCTSKFLSSERSSRWSGQNKDECGLHLDLVKK
jgi:phosphoadenosine phosphosulfate reductase